MGIRQISGVILTVLLTSMLTLIPIFAEGHTMASRYLCERMRACMHASALDGVEIQGELTLSPDLGYSVTPIEHSLDGVGEEDGLEETADMPYNLDMIDVEKVCQDGEDVYVAVLDTGLMYNWMNYLPAENIRTDLGKGYSYHTIYWNTTAQDFYLDDFWDTRDFITEFGQPWEQYGAPYGDGHGTHVTSVITGYKYVSAYWGQEFWVRGVAPKVQIIPVLVLDTWIGYVPPGQSIPSGYYIVGGGLYQMVASGINYIADLAETLGIKIVINLSLGGPSSSDLVEDAIDNAIEKGCIVVAAAGNMRYKAYYGEYMDYPGAYSPVISAASGGWTMENIGSGSSPHEPPYRWWLSDVPECFHIPDDNNNTFQLFVNDFSGRPNSEWGQSWCDLDVCGPGSWIVGPYSPYGCLIAGGAYFGYYYVVGTSQATPHVSGIATSVLEKCPSLVQSQMHDILKLAGLSNPMTEEDQNGTAMVYAYQGGGVYAYEEFTWTPWDYGTGFLQADAAISLLLLDLSVSSPDIFFSDANPTDGQSITISAKIHNLGEINVENVSVQFFDYTTPIGEIQISQISHYSYGTASITWTAEGEGFHLIKVVVDPRNEKIESEEDNNEATRSILVGDIPHLGGIIVNASVAPNETRAGCSVIVQGYAEYNTTYGTGTPVAGAKVTVTIAGLVEKTTHTRKDGIYESTITAPNAPGDYTIVVAVTDFTFWEGIKIGLNVTREEGVDLTLSSAGITFSPPDPLENENVNITATIHNVGTQNATDIFVVFYDDGEPSGNRTIDQIAAGESEDTMVSWNATPRGWHTITVVIDPENTTGEPPEARNNNEASKPMYVYPPLADLTPTNIGFSDNTPLVDQTITISANVENIGGVSASNVLVSFYDGNQSIGNTTIPWIPGKRESRTASINYSFTVKGSHLINATVDIEDNIPEEDELNNWLSTNILVHDPSPDLTLSSSDITFSDSKPMIGDIVTVYATIHNIGEEDAEEVLVEFFDGSTRIDYTTIPWVNASEQGTVDASWNATPAGWHRIKVVIDGNDTIKDEINENNNQACRYINVRPPPEESPDVCIYSEDIVFSNTNPEPGENVTIYATVHNIGNAAAENVTVVFYIDDVQVGPIHTLSSLPADDSTLFTQGWIASQIGSHVTKVSVDAAIESNKENNVAVATRAIIVGKRDLAVVSVSPSETQVYEGDTVTIDVIVRNEGDIFETFSATVFYNGSVIQTQGNVTLDSGKETTVVFIWNTSSTPGNHRISAEVSIVPEEIDIMDNTLIDGVVEVVSRVSVPIKGGEDAIIEGNVTITKVVVTKNTLHFDASGPSGSTGWINVTFPAVNTTAIKVFINREKLTPPPFPIITTNGTHYFIYFEFNLSAHEIEILYAVEHSATVDITPDSLNLRSEGNYITVFIELPESCDVTDINVSTLLLNCTVIAELTPTEIGDYDKDGVHDLMVKFDRTEVIAYILENVKMEEKSTTVVLTVTGYLNDGTGFQGTDAIKVMLSAPKGIVPF